MERPVQPTRTEMYALLEAKIKPLGRSEFVSVWDADGRFAAKTLYAPYSLPDRPASDCDGIAVRFDDFADGMPEPAFFREGQTYVYSNTGVVLPDGYDTVIAIEDVERSGTGIRITEAPEARGQNVTPAGDTMKYGETLLPEGERLTPAALSVLAQAGFTSVPVLVRPRVVFIPTGDELVPFGGGVPSGVNVECNSVNLVLTARRFGAEASALPIIPDDPEKIRAAIMEAVRTADLVVIGAGSSKGTKDYTMRVLESVGEVLADELRVAPGKHCSLSMVEGVPVLGIPGPPGGAQLAGEYYMKAAIELMTTGAIRPVPTLTAVLDAPIEAMPMPMDFMQALRLSEKDGDYHAMPAPLWGETRAACRGDLYAVLYQEAGCSYAAGDRILVELPLAEAGL